MRISFAVLAISYFAVVAGCTGGTGPRADVTERPHVNVENICYHTAVYSADHSSDYESTRETLAWLTRRAINIDGLVPAFGVAPTIHLVSECGLQEIADEEGVFLTVEEIDEETYRGLLDEYLQANF